MSDQKGGIEKCDCGCEGVPALDRRERLRSADWYVAPIEEHREAVKLIEVWHYSKSAPNTSTYRHGLYRSVDGCLRGEAWGVALWIPPTRAAATTVANGTGWQSVLSLSRFVVDPSVPPNGASFLLGRSMLLVDRQRWPVLLTYADPNHNHTGAIYRATNWECLGEVPAGDVWVNSAGVQRGRKRGGHTLLAREMEAAGFTRQPATPKIKFVHRASA